MPSKLCVHPEGGSEESYSVQGAGHDRLVDILLTGWWGGNWKSASSTFWFQPVWGLRACGQHTATFSHLGGFSICKTAQGTWLRIFSIVLEEELKVHDFV